MRKQYWQAVAVLSGGILLPFFFSYILGDQTSGAAALQAFLNWIGTTFRQQNVALVADVREALHMLLGGVTYAALIYLALRFRFLRYLAAVGIVFLLSAACGVLPDLAFRAEYGEYAALFMLMSALSTLFFSALYLILYPIMRLSRRFLKRETLSVTAGAAVCYIAELLVILLLAMVAAQIFVVIEPGQSANGYESWALIKEIAFGRFLKLMLGVLFFFMAAYVPRRNRTERAPDGVSDGEDASAENNPALDDGAASGEESPAEQDASSGETDTKHD